MTEIVNAITWDAPEYKHVERSSDWFWVLGIISFCGALAAFFFGNFLLSILILVGGGVVALQSGKKPRISSFMVGTRGVRIGERLYPYTTISSYKIDEDNIDGPRLLLKPKKLFDSLIVMPIPEENIQDIENLVRDRLSEEDIEDPVASKLLEIVGF